MTLIKSTLSNLAINTVFVQNPKGGKVQIGQKNSLSELGNCVYY